MSDHSAPPSPAWLSSDEIAPQKGIGDIYTRPRAPISFALPFALSSLNIRQRTHWAELSKQRKVLLQEVMAAIGGPRYYPRPPFDRARVTVVRCSAGQLDPDNLAASCKPLLDVLCVGSPTHPGSLGIIEDDNPRQCELVVKQNAVGRGDSATLVMIEHLPGGPLQAPAKPKRGKPAWVGKKDSPSRIRAAHAAGVWRG